MPKTDLNYHPENTELFYPDFLWQNRRNRIYLVTAFSVFIVQFILFKLRYPFANYMPDSYSYLDAASRNLDVNMWPVAYSKFLRIISAITHSDKVVVGLQFFFLQASSVLFLLTFIFFVRPGKWVENILLIFVLLNPVPFYVSNYISADALFIGMSLLWLSSLLWIVFRPKPVYLVFQAVLLLACFTIRYNAIYYPIIAALAIVLSPQPRNWKIAGITVSILLVSFSYGYTSIKMREQTGQRQFSAFGGWQLANNALYMYEHIPAGERKPVPARFHLLDTMVRQHMDTLQRVRFTREDSLCSYFYLWSSKGPLIQYLIREWKKDSSTPYFNRWAAEGPLYQEYGFYLIRQYPAQFAKYWIYPNSVRYVVPPTEFLGVYNMGGDSVHKLAKDWFNYKSLKIKDHSPKRTGIFATEWYPVFSALVNILVLISFTGLLLFNGFRRRSTPLIRVMFLILPLWLINMGFSIFAAPVVLRYQLFVILVSFFAAMAAMEKIYHLGKQEELTKKAKPALS